MSKIMSAQVFIQEILDTCAKSLKSLILLAQVSMMHKCRVVRRLQTRTVLSDTRKSLTAHAQVFCTSVAQVCPSDVLSRPLPLRGRGGVSRDARLAALVQAPMAPMAPRTGIEGEGHPVSTRTGITRPTVPHGPPRPQARRPIRYSEKMANQLARKSLVRTCACGCTQRAAWPRRKSRDRGADLRALARPVRRRHRHSAAFLRTST